MPITGIPLPFISYGGSNLVTCFAAIGIVQSVRMRRRLVKFNMYASGAAYYCASLYYSWKDEIVLDAYDIPDIIYIVIMLVIDVFYIMSILGGSFLGKKKRLNERQNMITNNK